jgi:hypothetical protein
MKFKSLYLIALVAVLGTSCKKEWLDVNTSPNSIATATPSYVFTNALNTTANNFVGPNEIGSYWAGHWTQSSSYILSNTTFAYMFTNGDFNYWDGFYDNLNDYQYVINGADAGNQKFLKGPAKVMKALLFQNLVDLYGNVPYSEALKATGNIAPKFDDQKAIYEDLIKLLDEAIVDIKANPFSSAFTGSDLVFSGNTTRWAQFANSLKMRILIHQSRIAGRDAYIIPEINKIVAEGSGFITNTEVGVGGASFFVNTSGKLNPIYERWGYTAAGAVQSLGRYPRATTFFLNSLKATNDTFRMKRLFYAKGGEGATPGVSASAELSSNYVGAPFGIGSGFTAANVSAIGPAFITKNVYNKPLVLMTAAEVQFLLAEAKQRYPAVNLPGTAQSYYEEGVRQSFRALGATTAQANILLTSGIADADWAASTNKLQAIAVQKWIALAEFSGLEAWTEYRRTNLPVTPQSAVVANANRPLRLFYPATELGANTANVTAQGTIDIFTTRIFWDVD